MNVLPSIADQAGSAGEPAQSATGIVFLLGSVRSGSTLLDMLLGQHPAVCSTGELHCLWEYWNDRYKRPSICTCGEHIRDCEFWQAVVNRLESEPGVEMESFQTRIHSASRRLARWKTLLGRSSQPTESAQTESARNSLAAVDAVGRSQNARWVVDSSKHVARALAYLGTVESDRPLKLLFLMRGALGSAHSIATRGNIPLAAAVIAWLKVNLQCFAVYLQFPSANRVFVRYEELCANPPGTIARVLSELDLEPAAPPKTVPSHNLGGSPSRHDFDPTRIVEDNRYRTALRWYQKLWIRCLTLPVELAIRTLCRMPSRK